MAISMLSVNAFAWTWDSTTKTATTSGTDTMLGLYTAASDAVSITDNAYVTLKDSIYINGHDTSASIGNTGEKLTVPNGYTLNLTGSGTVKARLDVMGDLRKATSIKLTDLYLYAGATVDFDPTIEKDGNGEYVLRNDTSIRVSGPVNGIWTISGRGGGGGGGGSAKPTTPSTDPSKDVTVTVQAKVDGNTATVAIPSKTVNTAINDAVKNNSANITLKVEGTGDATEVTATLPASSASSIASRTNASVSIETPAATVILSNSAIGDLAKEAKTTVGVTTEAKEDGTTVVTILADGKAVDKVPGGVKAALPLTSAQRNNSTVVVLVNADGTEKIIKKSALKDDAIVAQLKDGTSVLKVKDNGKSFTDSKSHWGSTAIDFVSSRELFSGTGANTFAPELSMNRAMLVTVLYSLEDATFTGGSAFGDVPSDSWFTNAVAWATREGITSGTGAGFSPDSPISRQDMATMLYKYAQIVGMDTEASGTMNRFGDSSSISSYAETAMRWAVGVGIMSGDNNGNLRPGSSATRAEVATMIMRLVEAM